MPKKTKNDSANSAAATASADRSTPPVPATPQPARKRPAASKPPSRKVAAKKKTAGESAKKSAAKRPAKIGAASGPSDADIRTRAYFIAERRLQFGIPGDSAHDWLEAKRQLVDEASQKRA